MVGGLKPSSMFDRQTIVNENFYRKISMETFNNKLLMGSIIDELKSKWNSPHLTFNYVIFEPGYIYLLPISEGDDPFIQTTEPIIPGIGHSSIPWSVVNQPDELYDIQKVKIGSTYINKYEKGDVVLYAGELGFNSDYSLAWWNSVSGHYLPVPWWVEDNYVKDALKPLGFHKYLQSKFYYHVKAGMYEMPDAKLYDDIVNVTIYQERALGIIFGQIYPIVKKVNEGSICSSKGVEDNMVLIKLNYEDIPKDIKGFKAIWRNIQYPVTLTFQR